MDDDAVERLRLLESVVNNALDAVVLCDYAEDGEARIAYVNPAFVAQTGYRAEDVVGRHPRVLVRADADVDAQRRLRDATQHHQSVTVELTHYRADGSTFYVENNATPVFDDNGICTHMVSIQRDITDRKQAALDLEHQALHDALTGLPNRTLLANRLRGLLESNTAVALLLMDLDRFKTINDTLGHDFGDQVLQQVGRRLEALLRSDDTIARLGGDEFAFLLPDLHGPEEAELIVAQLLDGLREPFDVAGVTVPIDASIGVAFAPQHGGEASLLMQRADLAMYRAKEQVTGYAVYDADPDDARLGGLALLVDLRRAIEDDQLVLHYQPVVDLKTGTTAAVEALLRWEHPTRGLVMPDEFIGLAEETGLIGPLTEWMLGAALAQTRAWHDAGWPIRVSVNISARLVADRELPERIAAALEQSGLPSGALQLEITESALMVHPEWALAVFERLAQLGVRLTLDDFGTGYSSLAYLKRLPAHQVKIDKTFVLDMLTDLKDAAIVRAVIELAHSLGLTVVAEGVENDVTRQVLAHHGCDFGQGFVFGHAMPAASFRTEN